MSSATVIPGSKAIMNPKLDLYTVPPSDVSILSRRFISISPFTTGITPVDINVEAQSTYTDWSQSYLEITWEPKKSDGTAVTAGATTKIFPVNLLPHSMLKQVSVRLNGTLLNQQADTYPYNAYLTTLINYSPDEVENVLQMDGFYNVLDPPLALTANEMDKATPHNDYKGLSDNHKKAQDIMRAEAITLTRTKRTYNIRPFNELFNLPKLLVPGVAVNIKLHFHPPAFFMQRYGGSTEAYRLTEADIKVKLMLCTVNLHPTAECQLKLQDSKVVSYPCVRGEIRTYTIGTNERHVEINDPGNGRIPNFVMIGLVKSAAFNGSYGDYPFAFGKYNLSSLKQLLKGEEYPYQTLELNHDNAEKDVGYGYWRFLEATGCLRKRKGNLVSADDWGQGKYCTLFAFDNTANGMLHSRVLNPKLSGELRYVLDFGANPGENLIAVVYCEYETILEIDSNKTVLYRLTQ